MVVAYGLILPKEILNAAKFGCINIHPSHLPKWRGAAPIQRTLMSGEEQTAINIIKMSEGIDDVSNSGRDAIYNSLESVGSSR